MDLPVGTIAMGLAGGLALFLYGMELMTDALKAVAGNGLRTLLATLTKNRFTAALTGAFTTAVIQSSSVTTVLVVGFVSAGLMTLAQAVGVIMGANIGTTITAQIVAFKVTKYALLLIALGFLMSFTGRKPRTRHWGEMLLGLGLIFFGMGLMSEATNPLRSYQPFIDLMQRMNNPLLGMLVGAAFTALVQSSSATTGVVIVLAGQGFISLEAGIALAFGSNVGTCVTALLATLGKPRTALRAAMIHVVFNVVGVMIWVFFIDGLAQAVRGMSPVHAELEGAKRLAAETPRQIANAHTVFNIVNTLIFLPFTGYMALLVERLIPEKPEVLPERARPKFLQEEFFEAPALAINPIRLELVRLGRHTQDLVPLTTTAVNTGEGMDDVVERHGDDARLYETILSYIQRVSQEEISPRQARLLRSFSLTASNLNHIGEIFATNVVALARERERLELPPISEEERATFAPLRELVTHGLAEVLDALEREDAELARAVIRRKREVQETSDGIHDAIRAAADLDDPKSASKMRTLLQVIELLGRIYYFEKRIAKDLVRELESLEATIDLESEPS